MNDEIKEFIKPPKTHCEWCIYRYANCPEEHNQANDITNCKSFVAHIPTTNDMMSILTNFKKDLKPFPSLKEVEEVVSDNSGGLSKTEKLYIKKVYDAIMQLINKKNTKIGEKDV